MNPSKVCSVGIVWVVRDAARRGRRPFHFIEVKTWFALLLNAASSAPRVAYAGQRLVGKTLPAEIGRAADGLSARRLRAAIDRDQTPVPEAGRHKVTRPVTPGARGTEYCTTLRLTSISAKSSLLAFIALQYYRLHVNKEA